VAFFITLDWAGASVMLSAMSVCLSVANANTIRRARTPRQPRHSHHHRRRRRHGDRFTPIHIFPSMMSLMMMLMPTDDE